MKRNSTLSMLALLLFLVVPLCSTQDDPSPSSSEPNSDICSKVIDDVHQALNDITTLQGWQKPLEITDKHGFTTQAAQLLWDSCKPHMIVVGASVLCIVMSLKRAAIGISTAAALAYTAKLCLDRYH